jgi:lysophospholipase L1-like esterase
MHLSRRALLVLSVLAGLSSEPRLAAAAPPAVVRFFSLPGAARPLAIAAGVQPDEILIGTSRRGGHDELYALSTGEDGVDPSISWSLDLGTHVNAIAADGERVYVATSADRSELIVVDAGLRAVVGTFDAGGPGDATTIEVVAPGEVLLGRRRGSGPEIVRLDVADPARIQVLEAIEDPRGVRPPPPERLARYFHRGRLAGRIARASARGRLHYLAVKDRNAELHVVEEPVPVVFPDVNGDGAYVLGCVGDSNTVPRPGQWDWCAQLAAKIDDPDFRVVNVAVSGATVVVPNRFYDSDAAQQMDDVLALQADAVVLSFGTNDLFQGRSPLEIHDAYLAREAQALAAGVAFFVATTPPIANCGGPSCPAILASNGLLRTSFAGRIVEFFDGFLAAHFYADGFHVNPDGHALRAERAFATLANPALYPAD